MKTLKKVLIFLIVLVSVICLIPSYNVKADSLVLTMTNGASIRTTGEQGLRYLCTASSDFEEGVEHGYYLVKGKQTKTALRNAIKNGDSVVGGNKLVKKVATGTSASFAVTVINIDDANYDKEISVIAYAKVNDEFVFSDVSVTRNIADVARSVYNTSTDVEDYISSIAEAMKIKVTNGSNVTYYNAISDITLQDGDTLDLVKGNYTDQITINKNNITVKGKYSGILGTSSSRIEELETNLKETIVIEDNVSNVEINGLTFSGKNVLELHGNQDKVTLKYSRLLYTGNYGVKDVYEGYESAIHSNIELLKCYSKGGSSKYTRDIYLQGFVNNINIESNTFDSKLLSLDAEGNDNAIRLNRISDNSYVNIKTNTFKHKAADYLVYIGSGHSSNSISAIINIEDNAGLGSDSGKGFLANGFKIVYIGSNSIINFIHNEKMRFSRYYNTILFSQNTGTGSADVSSEDTTNPIINLKYNKLYGASSSEITNPGRTTNLSTNYIEIGLGFPASASRITIDYNYFSGTVRGYSFKSNTSQSSSKNIYGAGVIAQLNEAESYTIADAKYDEYVTEYTTFNNYIESFNVSVDSVSDEYAEILELTDDVLTYTGSDAGYAISMLKAGHRVAL